MSIPFSSTASSRDGKGTDGVVSVVGSGNSGKIIWNECGMRTETIDVCDEREGERDSQKCRDKTESKREICLILMRDLSDSFFHSSCAMCT